MKTNRHSITHFQQEAGEEDLEGLKMLPLFLRLFRHTNPYAKKRNWLIFLVLLRSALLPCLAWAVGAVINGPITAGNIHGIVVGAIGFAVLSALTQFTFHFRIRLSLELGEAVIHDIRNKVFAHLLRLPMSFYDRVKAGRIIGRMTSDIDAMRQGVQEIVFVGTVQVGQMLFSAVLMLWYDSVLFVVVLGIAPVVWFLHRHFSEKISLAQRRAQESFSRVTATLVESVHGIRVTQGFVRQDTNGEFFRELVTDHSRYSVGAGRTSAVFLPLLELNSQFFIAVLIILGGYRVLNPDIAMPVGDIVQFFFLANLFFDPIKSLGNQYNNALTAMVGAERVFRLLDTEPEWTDPPDAVAPAAVEGRIEFRNVSFGYDPEKLVLREVSFTALPGQSVALVGHTGSGKTSIINLIAKFYLPTDGDLLVDGHSIRTMDSDALHRQMGIVNQHPFLLEGTVADNIRFSRPEATDEEVIEAVRQLDFLDMIATLADGFHTQVGEAGCNLSLGQRQLVSFARSLLADPRILILDEATSSIDTLTEARLQASLGRLVRGRTSFVVAHRLSTIRNADLVLVLDHGRIVERGTHRELLAAGGEYSRLHRQFVRQVQDRE